MPALIIPEILNPIAHILTHYLQPLLSWASQLMLQRLVTQHRNHPLVRLHTLLDFSPLEQACVGYHQERSGLGHTTNKAAAAQLANLGFGGCGGGDTSVITSFDPNDILGPNGFGDDNHIVPDRVFGYTIRFENDPDETTARPLSSSLLRCWVLIWITTPLN